MSISKADEAAAVAALIERDAEWFKQHPDASQYFRPAETADFLLLPPDTTTDEPPCMEPSHYRMVVHQLSARGLRVRLSRHRRVVSCQAAPVNDPQVDDPDIDPPTATELAHLKQFLDGYGISITSVIEAEA